MYVACNEAHSVLGFVLMVLMTVVYPVEVENWSLIWHREHLELQLQETLSLPEFLLKIQWISFKLFTCG